MNSKYIKSFLNFGYDINFNSEMSFDYSNIKPLENYSYSEAKDMFLTALQKSTNDHNGSLVVPLSGGLDSRLILAGLLELYSTDIIKTYTYGSPGTYDFDIGVNVAKKLGVRNKQYDLSRYQFTDNTLDYSSKLFSQNTLLFYQAPYEQVLQDFSQSKLVIGFMGDPIAGSHFDINESSNDLDIFRRFIKKNQFVKSIKLIDFDENELINNYDLNTVKNLNISKTEFLDFEIRQLKYIQPHVMPCSLDTCSPFIEQEVFDYFMGVASKDRHEQKFYDKFLFDAFRNEFKIGCKNKLGLPLNSSNKVYKVWRALHRIQFLKKRTINYQNFNERICCDSNLNKLVQDLLASLEKRQLDLKINPVELFNLHCNSQPIYSDALITMASLEVNLRNKQHTFHE
jgi:hypothetical protein